MEHRVEQQEQQQEAAPASKLCIKHCGFYGNPACLDMCSKCYREHMSEEQKKAAAAAAPLAPAAPAAAAAPPPAAALVPAPAAEAPAPAPEKPAAAEEAPAPVPMETEEAPAKAVEEAAPEKPVQANRNRCFCCKKKVGLLGFECRCGYVYCSSHRHAQEHNCTFDYKSMDRLKLAQQNPTVAAARVNKF